MAFTGRRIAERPFSAWLVFAIWLLVFLGASAFNALWLLHLILWETSPVVS
jgi:hypothetical protein